LSKKSELEIWHNKVLTAKVKDLEQRMKDIEKKVK